MHIPNPYSEKLTKKQILVVGLGSAGRRHALLAEGMGADVSVVSRRDNVGDYHELKTALKDRDWDLIVIATETADHAETLNFLNEVEFSGKILVEKPLFSEVEAKFDFQRLDINVAYNLRLHLLVTQARQWLSSRLEQLVGAQFYVGQHLSDWRPDRDMSETYSASRKAGGGVLRDLSHELDLANWLLGPVKSVTALGGKTAQVTHDADDFWHVLAEHEKCENVSIHLNYLDQPAKRIMKFWTATESLEVDFLSGRVQEGRDYITLPMEPSFSYQEQLIEVFKPDNILCSYEDGQRVMEYINAVEEAASSKSWISLGGEG